MTLTQEDLTDAAAAVRDLVCAEVAPATARPERPAGPAEVARIVAAAERMGLVGRDAEEELGLWTSDEPAGVELAKRFLAAVAEANAGVAFHLAAIATGAAACRELLFEDSGEDGGGTVAAVQAGAGRGALGPVLRGEAVTPEESAELAGLLPGEETFVQAADGWRRLLVPRFEGRTIVWELYERDALDVERLALSHGLDETSAWRVGRNGAEPVRRGDRDGPAVLCRALSRSAVSTMAIAAGATRTALVRARRYAGERRQGGRLIRHHPAVQLLLGQAETGLAAAEALLEGAGVASELGGLRRTLRLRAAAHPLLCQAATDALQVFGGYGYMRDVGMEKILRDNQHLKLLYGTPREIFLFLGSQQEDGE